MVLKSNVGLIKRDGKWLLYIWMTKKDIHPSKNVTPVVFKPIYHQLQDATHSFSGFPKLCFML